MISADSEESDSQELQVGVSNTGSSNLKSASNELPACEL